MKNITLQDLAAHRKSLEVDVYDAVQRFYNATELIPDIKIENHEMATKSGVIVTFAIKVNVSLK